MVVLLVKKIVELFLIMFAGFALVKLGVVKSKDATVLSKLSLYILMPCMILNSFNVKLSSNIKQGLLLALIASVVFQGILLCVDFCYSRLCKVGPTERTSAMYSNAANLIIPLVTAMLGEKWLIYTMPFLTVQFVMLWTHAIRLFDSESKFSFKKLFLNVNMITFFLGLLLLLFDFQLPAILGNAIGSVGGMIGNVGMLICGMLAAGIDIKKTITNKSVWSIILIRMIICPSIALLFLKIIPVERFMAGAEDVLLVTFLATMTPCAATIMQFAQLHNREPELASAANIMTTLICIVTMPAFVWLYLNI